MKFNDEKTQVSQEEVFDSLLLAGYFRIRIPTLPAFDKLLGGFAWGILNSNFPIDIDLYYEDEQNMKTKMKLSEKIVQCLRKMRCPHSISPIQIQGLDFTGILPALKWLLTFVGSTR
jgi:hypothetical protein